MAKNTGATEKVRQMVLARSNYHCEKCGKNLSGDRYSIHHRIPRGMGGSDRKELNYTSNLLALCGSGTTGCHGWIESHRATAYENGWLCYRNDDPAEIVVVVARAGGVGEFLQYVLLSNDGQYLPS